MKKLFLVSICALMVSSAICGCQKKYDPADDKVVYEDDRDCDDATYERLNDAVASLTEIYATASDMVANNTLTLDENGEAAYEEAANLINDYCDVKQKDVTQKEAEATIESINQLTLVFSQLTGTSVDASDSSADTENPEAIKIPEDGIYPDGTYVDDTLNEHIDASDDETPPDLD